jgi:acetyl esterase
VSGEEVRLSAANTPTDLLARLFSAPAPRSVSELRTLLDGFAALLNQGLPEVGAFHEGVPVREVAGCEVRAEVVVPVGAPPHPVLLYLHGGGWVSGSPSTHRKLAHRFAQQGFLVVSPDYRLAPEHPFPAGFEDALHALGWVAREAARFGGDPSRLAIGGDSAGANLAAAVAALAPRLSAPLPRAALLLYGVFDFATLRGLAAPGDPLATLLGEMLDLMLGSYLGSPAASPPSDPRLSPLLAAHRLPPSYVLVGGADPLVDQAAALAAALARAGVPHEHDVVPGMPHGFCQMEFLPPARASVARMADFLRRHLTAS